MSVVEVAAAELTALVRSNRGVRGALLATVDGRPIAAALVGHDADSTAAIIASSRGLGERLADLAGSGDLQEIVVRSSSGYVVIYSAGPRGVLTLLTDSAANIAMLHLKARDLANRIAVELKYLVEADVTSTHDRAPALS